MNITIWGGTGYAGSHIAAEAAKRGHAVTVISRKPGETIDGVAYATGSILDAEDRARSLNADIVVVAVSPRGDMAEAMGPAVKQLVAEATAHGTRFAIVGGAGSLLTEPHGPRVVDLPEFPDEYKGEALTLAGILDTLRASDASLNWFFVSPPDVFGSYATVASKGTYRIGGDVRLQALDADGNPVGLAEISGEDFGLAFVDEIERNDHNRERFTVAS